MKAKRILASVLSVALLFQLSPLNIWALDEDPQQTPPVSTVQENIDATPAEEPTPVEEPAPVEDPTLAAEPVLLTAAAPVLLTAAAPAPTAVEAQDPAAEEPAATEKPTSTEEPTATEEPTSTQEPAAEEPQEPTAAQAVQALIDALPDEVTDDNAEEVAQALTDIDDAKESLTDDELAGLDFARYDAAANALLALWGEAPADAVELLDNIGTQPNLIKGWYQITNADELKWFANEVNNNGNTNISAILVNDIIVNRNVLNGNGDLNDPTNFTPWTPIGTKDKPFTGTFDGGGKTISGLYIDDSSKDYVGLFGYIGANGTVKNVTLADSSVSGYQYVGGICGYNNCGTVEDCTSDCTVRGTHYIGGICGYNGDLNSRLDSGLGYVRNCHNTGKVTGTGFRTGGVCGLNYGILQNCHNTGNVTGGSYYTAGVCGWNGKNGDGTNIVEKSYNTGTVTGKGDYVGGVCGQNLSTLKECYNIGTVTGTTNVGGVCGENGESAYVQDCYYFVTVSNGQSNFGAICGKVSGRAPTNCYYLDTSTTNAGGGISKTEVEFNSGEVAYLLQGTSNVPTWGQTIPGDSYPVLGGKTVYYNETNGYHNHDDNTECDGCAPKPTTKTDADGKIWYIIKTAEDLQWFANEVNKKGESNINAILENDITINSDVLNKNGELNTDASANFTQWTPIGTDAKNQMFTGTFDGNGKTIRGLYFDDNAKVCVGLFGCVGTNGKVINVTLADSYVSGKSYVGGICGMNKGGTVTGCHNSGRVTGSYINIGGVCGQNGGKLQNSYNTGDVSGNSLVGGVCGQNDGTLQNSYNTGEVTGTENVGGVCGQNYGNGIVKICYNTGDVSGNSLVGGVCGQKSNRVSDCYYLSDTSGTASGGCTPKTEAEFQSGEVAFFLQKALGPNATQQVWGQRIGIDKAPVLSSETAYRVYETLIGSPCEGYTNQQGHNRDHDFNTTVGVCKRCGAWQEAELATDGSYYKISNQGQLRWFAAKVNSGNSAINARLMESFAMDDTEWTPIGKENQPFKGTFDGDGKTITGLTCTNAKADYVGLVGYAVDATIQNVTVKDSSLNGKEHIGGVCGRIENGTITNCHAVNTTIGEITNRITVPQYCGGIVGSIVRLTTDSTSAVTDCTNSGTVRSGQFCGGIAGEAQNATVQRCFNSGEVTGKYSSIGGIAGQAYDATVQDCGNTGAVTRINNDGNYGGIVGSTVNAEKIQNCYNANSTIAYPICVTQATFSNCYYLANNSGNTGTGITAKTEAQFASGEVAYLLQGDRPGTTNVWGQKINGDNRDSYPVLNGLKVYQTAPCTAGYGNEGHTHKDHDFGSDGYCKDCHEPNIAYTVTIPATVALGKAADATADIIAENVTLPANQTLTVTINGPFTAKLEGTNETAQYTIKKDGTALVSGGTVLTAQNGDTTKTSTLTFVKPSDAPYAGSYTGTVTFNVSVG